ncbi:MAG: sulfotransferase [Bacteroidales bacterium]|nr:sulfotransferase [Bacteroidales bacterium]
MKEESCSSVPIFFILGRPRSGTTLLRILLDAHPNVVVPPEFPIIPILASRFRRIKQWDEKTVLSFVDHIYENHTFGHRSIEQLKIDRDVLTHDLLDPLPDAKFVCLVRDYRDTFCSLRELNGTPIEAPNLALQTSRWRYVVKQFLKTQDKFPGRFYIVKYEDLVSQPEHTFRKITTFLNIPYDESVFSFYLHKEKIAKTYTDENMRRFHKHLLYPINTSHMNIWKDKMGWEEVAVADQIAGTYADRLGYQRISRKFSLALYLKSRPMALYSYLLFKFLEYGILMPYGFRKLMASHLRNLVAVYMKLAPKTNTRGGGYTPTHSENKTVPARSLQSS